MSDAARAALQQLSLIKAERTREGVSDDAGFLVDDRLKGQLRHLLGIVVKEYGGVVNRFQREQSSTRVFVPDALEADTAGQVHGTLLVVMYLTPATGKGPPMLSIDMTRQSIEPHKAGAQWLCTPFMRRD